MPHPSPVLLEAVLLKTRVPTEQHHNTLLLGRDEAQHKDILIPTVVALQEGLPQGTVLMQGHLLAL